MGKVRRQEMIQPILEYLAIACFVGLAVIGFIGKNYNYAGMNISLVILYIFLYIQPFK